jgi:hypothetical protein
MWTRKRAQRSAAPAHTSTFTAPTVAIVTPANAVAPDAVTACSMLQQQQQQTLVRAELVRRDGSLSGALDVQKKVRVGDIGRPGPTRSSMPCWDCVDVYTGTTWPPPTVGQRDCRSMDCSGKVSKQKCQWQLFYNPNPTAIAATGTLIPKQKRQRYMMKESITDDSARAFDTATAVIAGSVVYDPSAWYECAGNSSQVGAAAMQMHPKKRARASFSTTNSSTATTATTAGANCKQRRSIYDDNDDYCGVQLWDPTLANQAEANGEKIIDFLSRATEVNMHMLAMECLHQCRYNVHLAQQQLDQALPNAATKGLMLFLPSAQLDQVHLALRHDSKGKRHISQTKDFAKLAQRLHCRIDMLLVHYYIWKSTTCVFCDESGGSILECPTCGASSHVKCVKTSSSSENKRLETEQRVYKVSVQPCLGSCKRRRKSTFRNSYPTSSSLSPSRHLSNKPSLVQDVFFPISGLLAFTNQSICLAASTCPGTPFEQVFQWRHTHAEATTNDSELAPHSLPRNPSQPNTTPLEGSLVSE